MTNEIDKTTCWYDSTCCESILDFATNMSMLGVAYPSVLESLFSLIVAENDQRMKLLDIGCGSSSLQSFEIVKNNFEYCGVDLPWIINEVARRAYPDSRYIEKDLTDLEELDLLRGYEVIVMNGFIDIMQYPIEMLIKVLSYSDKYVLVHRQRITSAKTYIEECPSFGGKTFHAVINNEEFENVINKSDFKIIRKELDRKKKNTNIYSYLLRRF